MEGSYFHDKFQVFSMKSGKSVKIWGMSRNLEDFEDNQEESSGLSSREVTHRVVSERESRCLEVVRVQLLLV